MNLTAIRAIYMFEMARFFRTLTQSFISPVISTSLYFVVFGAARPVRRSGCCRLVPVDSRPSTSLSLAKITSRFPLHYFVSSKLDIKQII